MHHRIADRLRDEILDRADQMGLSQHEAQTLSDALRKPENQAYYFLGCQGPDPFFFHTKDLSPALRNFVSVYLDFVGVIEGVKDIYRERLQPAVDAIISSSSTLQQIEKAYKDIKLVMDTLFPIVTAAVKSFVTEFNAFDVLSHPYRDGAQNGEWWWFDAMHYRRTGRLAAALLDAAPQVGSPEHLFALGYLTHVGADTVGHSYVNLWSGGPYRSQAQRHKTGENFQDVLYFDPGAFHPGAPFEASRLHWLYNFNYDGTGDVTDPDDRGPSPNFAMPGDLAKTIAETLNQVYDADGDGAPDFSTAINASDVADAYELYFSFIKSATEALPEPQPYSLTDELEDVWIEAATRLSDVSDFVHDSGSFSGVGAGLLGLLNKIARAILGGFKMAAAFVDAVLASIATISLAGLRQTAALVYDMLYNVWEQLHEGVALGGLGFPLQRHLSNPHFAQFIAPNVPDITNVEASQVVSREPLLRFKVDFFADPQAKIFNKERHLTYPLTDGEKRSTTVAPASYLTRTPPFYAQGRIPLDLALLDQLSMPSALTENEVEGVIGTSTLGNAIDLSAALYGRWKRGEPLPDFNLDSDRGYGYPCWTQPNDPPNTPSALKTNSDAGDITEVTLRTLRTGGEP
ncbi:MAG: hypothetical protein AAFN04_10760 [Pseudomonadota bacterium]